MTHQNRYVISMININATISSLHTHVYPCILKQLKFKKKSHIKIAVLNFDFVTHFSSMQAAVHCTQRKCPDLSEDSLLQVLPSDVTNVIDLCIYPQIYEGENPDYLCTFPTEAG